MVANIAAGVLFGVLSAYTSYHLLTKDSRPQASPKAAAVQNFALHTALLVVGTVFAATNATGWPGWMISAAVVVPTYVVGWVASRLRDPELTPAS